jgi:DNA-binding IclR family transcriptional regulator
VRRRGYATAADELELGLSALAAPVNGAGGEVVAALSISAPTIRLPADRMRQLAPPLLEQARALSARLGTHELATRR